MEQAAELDTLRQECRELENKIRQLGETLEQPDVREQMETVRQEADAKKLLISHADSYLGKKNELLFAPLQMNRVSISLSEVVKGTGETKDYLRREGLRKAVPFGEAARRAGDRGTGKAAFRQAVPDIP